MTLEAKECCWLVAHDFSTCADAAADLAVDDLLGSRRGGRVILAHIFAAVLPPTPIDVATASDLAQNFERSARIEITRSLERVAERLRARVRAHKDAPPIEIEVTSRLGTPAEGILEEAAARDVMRVIVGTHGRTGIKHLLLGSVAERIARLSKVPVVIAHASEAPLAS